MCLLWGCDGGDQGRKRRRTQKTSRREGAELRLREGPSEEGEGPGSWKPGLDGGHRRPSRLLTRSSPAHFAGLVPASILGVGRAALTVPALQEDRAGGEARDESTETLGYKLAQGWGAGWAGEGTMHLGLVLGWEMRSWAGAGVSQRPW